jgi:hypothetical protein
LRGNQECCNCNKKSDEPKRYDPKTYDSEAAKKKYEKKQLAKDPDWVKHAKPVRNFVTHPVGHNSKQKEAERVADAVLLALLRASGVKNTDEQIRAFLSGEANEERKRAREVFKLACSRGDYTAAVAALDNDVLKGRPKGFFMHEMSEDQKQNDVLPTIISQEQYKMIYNNHYYKINGVYLNSQAEYIAMRKADFNVQGSISKITKGYRNAEAWNAAHPHNPCFREHPNGNGCINTYLKSEPDSTVNENDEDARLTNLHTYFVPRETNDEPTQGGFARSNAEFFFAQRRKRTGVMIAACHTIYICIYALW